MTVYVDALENWGWVLRGHKVPSCHMFTDSNDLAELHAVAAKIGMRLDWFQPHKVAPHYDLTASRRAAAVALGAISVGRSEASAIWKARRESVLREGLAPTQFQPDKKHGEGDLAARHGPASGPPAGVSQMSLF